MDKEFKDKEHMDLQLDMWTSTESVEREQYACVMMTTVVDPVDTTVAGAQLRLTFWTCSGLELFSIL
jgi:hypothetical protein